MSEHGGGSPVSTMSKTEQPRKSRRYWRAGVAAIFVLGGLAVAALVIAEWRWRAYVPAPFYTGDAKVWAHRGFTGSGLAENTTAAFADAFARGAPGTELDVFYDVARGRYVVLHDAPRDFGAADLLELDRVFAAIAAPRFYWLDFKNLAELSPDEAQRAAQALQTLLAARGLAGRVIVESTDARNLAVFARAGLPTSYWVNFAPGEAWWRFRVRIFRIRRAVAAGRFTAISMDYTRYTRHVEESFARMPVHLFTVNSAQLIETLVCKPAVRIVLTDTEAFDRRCRP